jgi:murein L,D-transpeptidase YafK
MKRLILVLAAVMGLAGCGWGGGSNQVIHRTPIAQRLAARRLHAGAPVFIRIFKSEAVLELWLLDGSRYRLFEVYPVCHWSGRLGPKFWEGDWQAPEGFYAITPAQMNMQSGYHRAFNLGFPNSYDQANGRTGSNLMVHGGCSSAGCYAMTDLQIDEIFNLMEAAFAGGQRSIAVDVLPFRPTDAAIAAHSSNSWASFWRTLATGEVTFTRTGRPTAVFVCGKAYAFTGGAGCQRIRNAS